MSNKEIKLGWISDPHWETLDLGVMERRIIKHANEVNERFDIFVNTGDFSDSRCTKNTLTLLSQHVKIPYYFCLGNHDFYYSSIDQCEDLCEFMTNNNKIGRLVYGPRSTGEIILSGEDYIQLAFCNGFANGVSYDKSMVIDERFIRDFDGEEDPGELRRLISTSSILQLRKQIGDLKDIKELFLFTHVPPFREASLYNDEPCSDTFLPFFCDELLGLYLNSLSLQNPELKIKVFCGHTHNKCHYVKGNIEVFVAHGEYGEDFINEIIL